MNLLDNPKLVNKWMPRLLRGPFCWKVISGKWEIKPSQKIICIGQTKLYTGESIALIGPCDSADYSLKITLNILTDSNKPPEGGVILYSRFKNFNNYYSYHFCLFKKKIELIKRTKGRWSTISEQDFVFELNKSYSIDIENLADIHKCRINGKSYIEIEDKDTKKGCIGIGTKYCRAEFSRIFLELR